MGVEDDDVADAGVEKHVDACDARGSGAGDDHAQVGEGAVEEARGVAQCRIDDDGGAVLVVVHDGDGEAFVEAAFDLEAAWCGDVFEVDGRKRGRDAHDGVDDFVNIVGVEDDREGVQPGELLEELGFALHDGQGCLGADVPEPEDPRCRR